MIGMLASPHLARWLHAGRDCEADVLLIPSVPYRSLHPLIAEMLGRSSGLKVVVDAHTWMNPPRHSALQRLASRRRRARALAASVIEFDADLVHAVELQHGGYISRRALEGLPVSTRPLLSVVNWGSDIFWFSQKRRHRAELRSLLKMASGYSSECQRDVDLAFSFGFSGRAFAPVPNCGGFGIPPNIDHSPLGSRDTIAVKGYSRFVGRAHHLLAAWVVVNPEFNGARLEIYSATLTVRVLASILRIRNRNLHVVCHRHGTLTSDQMWALLLRSRVYVGFSASDGLSTSLLEAVSVGAVPIQSDSACIEDLRADGFHIVGIQHQRPFNAVRTIAEVFEDPLKHEDRTLVNVDLAQQLFSPERVARRSNSTLSDLVKWAATRHAESRLP